FFQAEDGIRDRNVTGVQTCALPIFNLVTLGIGAVIGAGIFVITGQVAALYAGPAVPLSMIVVGVACAFAGLCYAEMASAVPVAGSAYTYRSEEHTSELQSRFDLVCRLL